MQGILLELSAIDKADLVLMRRSYPAWKRGRIRNAFWRFQEFATAVADGDLRPRDEHDVTEAYVAALPQVPADDPSWDNAIDGLESRGVSRRPADWWLATTELRPDDVLPAEAPAPCRCGLDGPDDDETGEYPPVEPGALPDDTPGRIVTAWEPHQVELALPAIRGGSPDADDREDAMAFPATTPGPLWPNRENDSSYARIAAIASTGNLD